MGAVCARAGPDDIARMSSFGRNMGIAFQITDDLIGVMGDPKETQKPVGNDLREGKKSLPILEAMAAAEGAERRAIAGCFGKSDATPEELERAAGAIRSLGIEGAVRRQAQGVRQEGAGGLGAVLRARKGRPCLPARLCGGEEEVAWRYPQAS